MHTATGGADANRQAMLAHELGFDGVAGELADLPALRLACERLDADVFSAYAVLTLPAADAPPEQLAERLQPVEQALRALAGGPGMLWLAIRADGLAARDPAGEAALRRALQQLQPIVAATGVELALYPHHAFWLETADDALRVLAPIDDAKLGVCFNLCHELRAFPGIDPRPALRRCGPRLLAVTVNGADVAGADWSTLIRPLDEGDHALAPFLAELDALGFRGPVGLQGFGIKLPPREHLVRSLAAWRRVHDEPRGPK
jgi:sugar phosphate isomerase/epimerase